MQQKLNGIDEQLREWAENKKDLYLLLGRNLKVTQQNEFDVGDDEQYIKLKEISRDFPAEYYFLTNTFSFHETLYKNRVRVDDEGCRRVKSKVPNIKTGMKFSQFVHQVFENPKLDEAFSKFYGETKVNGFITVSIDPIDFLLSSLNNYGWTSCHTLYDDSDGDTGCHVAGIFSYMCDSSSMIAFRHKQAEEDDWTIRNTKIKAYSKMWRQMVYVDLTRTAFVCSRHYPGTNDSSEKGVRSILQKLMSERYGVENSWEYTRDDDYVSDAVYDCPNPLHYTDVKRGYHGTLVYNKALNNKHDVAIEVGTSPLCSFCGRNRLTDENVVMCDDCYNEYDDYEVCDEYI